MKTLYVIHHSHTDVGYTAPQGRVERWHADFIRQALDAIEASRPRVGEHFGGFRWVCETFWSVERFLARATATERDAFVGAVREGSVGLSASYLNLNELLDFEILSRVVRRATDYGLSIGVTIDSAMTTDVNGHGWGLSQALADCGIENLFTCVHTHHGMYPLGRKPVPFFWETPAGDRVLVWNGEHYHLGNELGVVPGAGSSYLIKDECDADMIYHDNWGVAERRIPRYFETLDDAGYPYDFAPVMASGLRSDNAPPSPAIVDFIERWNRTHGEQIRVEMVTLSQFFRRLRREPHEIVTHRGDWPDWWSDGPSGDPESTMLFREAQRGFVDVLALADRYVEIEVGDVTPLEDDLALYAEHTFGHAHAMSDPWHPDVHAIAERKKAHAACASDAAVALRDETLAAIGAAQFAAGVPLRFKIVNPLDRAVSGTAGLAVGHHEFHELGLDRSVEVRDASTGGVIPCQLTPVPLGGEFVIHVGLDPSEERVVEIRPAGAAGSVPAAPGRADVLETPFVRIAWRRGDGITSWLDRRSGDELLRADRRHGPFSPVHEITPMPDRDEICAVRSRMLLNRKGEGVRRTAGRLVGSSVVEAGPVFTRAALDYDVFGMSFYRVLLRALIDEPRVDVSVRMHKESAWEPENVYASLPFSPGGSPVLWIDKAGARVRPRIDQIPGTLTDFYGVQGGFALTSDGIGIAVSMLDNHLLQLGPLEPGERRLAGDRALESDPAHAYAWLMTNYWETNFSAELGGFFEFRYSVSWGPELSDHVSALLRARDASRDIICFRLPEAQ